ncbi:DivIVA domain-containing protein [Lactococcus termiticola]|uniref:Cell division protein GpsB n=1 Tax=Lactococcus termiticola TaxID=2169526 RepID=A0A2R5HK61_9LACT|nr:DivIVA domain-containing protein [Lactococcus termiticola]GBG97138.1 cell division protein GpsB [Lactococcus termiticola]
MADFKYTPKDIYEADFDKKMRGYDPEQVDELLDDVIADYETFQAEMLRLEEENEFLKKKVIALESQASQASSTPNDANMGDTQRFNPSQLSQAAVTPVAPTPTPAPTAKPEITNPSNFELLKRINRLEQAVFGSKGREAAASAVE